MRHRIVLLMALVASSCTPQKQETEAFVPARDYLIGAHLNDREIGFELLVSKRTRERLLFRIEGDWFLIENAEKRPDLFRLSAPPISTGEGGRELPASLERSVMVTERRQDKWGTGGWDLKFTLSSGTAEIGYAHLPRNRDRSSDK